MEENEPMQKEELCVPSRPMTRAEENYVYVYRCDAYERRNLDITIFECHIHVTRGYRYIRSILLDEYSIKDSLDEKSSSALKLRPKLFDKTTTIIF